MSRYYSLNARPATQTHGAAHRTPGYTRQGHAAVKGSPGTHPLRGDPRTGHRQGCGDGTDLRAIVAQPESIDNPPTVPP